MTKTQPTHDQSPVTQQADQQYFAQSGTQPVQYVLAAKSLKGVQGWLQFFVVILVLLSLGYINSFFGSLNHLSDPVAVVTMIFSPIIATLALLAVAFITMQKKLGKWFAAGTYLANTLFLLIKSITVFSVAAVVGLPKRAAHRLAAAAAWLGRNYHCRRRSLDQLLLRLSSSERDAGQLTELARPVCVPLSLSGSCKPGLIPSSSLSRNRLR